MVYWKEKDLIYAVGHIQQNKIKVLTFVYGDCYVADTEHYKEIRHRLIDNIGKLNFPFSHTKEIARINKLDPLGITNLRVRGMWTLKLPIKVFSNIMHPDLNLVSVFALMKKEKYESFDSGIRGSVEKELNVKDIMIRNPNKPTVLMDVKLISFSYSSAP